jgi:hypothetical protein
MENSNFSKVIKDGMFSPEDDASTYSNRIGSSRKSKRSELDSGEANLHLKKGQ